jgi:Uma2 family endonuclease
MLQMGLPQAIARATPEEYLRRERDAQEKHQYYLGEIFAMAGGTAHHSLIIANLIREIGNRTKGGPCRVYDSNLRIRTPRTVLYTYPDISVVCGELEYDHLDTQQETVTNPTLIIEVVSPSTEAWDRGRKFENYIQIESLRQYLLVSTYNPRVESYLRQADNTWLFSSTFGLSEIIQLRSIKIDLPLSEIFAGVPFPPNP